MEKEKIKKKDFATEELQELDNMTDALVLIEEIPESVVLEGTDSILAWFEANTTNEDILEAIDAETKPVSGEEFTTFGVIGCVSAVGVALVTLAWAPSKILKVKSALKALGGTTKFVTKAIDYYNNYRKLGYKRTIAWERAVKGASANVAPELKDALLGFFGITAIISACAE